MLQEWRPADEKELPIDLAAIANHLNPGDMHAALQKGLADDVEHAFKKQLGSPQREGGTMDAAQKNAKFAGSTFEDAYGNPEEYLAGVEKHIGLAAVKMYDGMKMQCCSAKDSKELFKVPNKGGYETTPVEEWNFVVNPDLARTYPGGRRIKLDVFNLAHGAQKHGGARLDIPLDSDYNRLEEVAKQNACSAKDLVDYVKTVALRWGRASYLSQGPLKRAIKKLKQVSDEQSEHITAA